MTHHQSMPDPYYVTPDGEEECDLADCTNAAIWWLSYLRSCDCYPGEYLVCDPCLNNHAGAYVGYRGKCHTCGAKGEIEAILPKGQR